MGKIGTLTTCKI